MDVAYDHIQEEALSPSSDQSTTAPQNTTNTSSTSPSESTNPPPASPTLQFEVSEAFKAAYSSPWGTTIGGWFSQARKQGESFYQDLQKEASEAQEQATKGFSSLREQVVQRTRSLSLSADAEAEVPGEEGIPGATTGSESEPAAAAEAGALQEVPESLPSDIVKEAGTLVASLRSTAASRLKDLQKAEDAADEALLKFGTNIRNFLRDAVVISAPDDSGAKEGEEGGEVLFETQEPGTGKKVFHSTRLDAQLHAIHTSASSFTEDPPQGPEGEGEEWERWTREFDIDSKTEDVARDLEKYDEVRRAMERLVPERVEYKAFWMRYYFLRKAIEEEEKRRREVLKAGASAVPEEEEIAWDDEDEETDNAAAAAAIPSSPPPVSKNKIASSSTTTLTQPHHQPPDLLKPNSPRRSHEDESKSVADSDASYDIVSGAQSHAAGSPKEEGKRELVAPGNGGGGVGGSEDEDEDWE